MKILMVTSSRLGDAVISTTILEALKTLYPDGEFTVAAGPVALPIFEDDPFIIRQYEMKKQRFGGHWFLLWQAVKNQRWDIVIDLRGSLLAYSVRAHRRLVFRGSHARESKHQQLWRWMQHQFPLLRDHPPILPHFVLRIERLDRVKGMLIDPYSIPIIAVAPKANWFLKEWSNANFLELIDRLTHSGGLFPRAKVIACASPQEHQSLGEFKEALGNRFISLPENLSLLDTAAVLRCCDLFIGNDSGLMHMAAALGVLTLGLFGPSNDQVYAPSGKCAHFIRTPESFSDLWHQVNQGTRENLMKSLTVDVVEIKIRGMIL